MGSNLSITLQNIESKNHCHSSCQ